MGQSIGGNRVAQRAHWGWFGLAFGCVLLVFGWASAEVGHGTYAPLALFGAPVSILPGAGLFAAPGWWALIGWLLSRRKASALLVLLLLHTLSGVFFLLIGTPYAWGAEHWKYFRGTHERAPLWLWTGLALYLIGQLVVWRLALKMRDWDDPSGSTSRRG